MELGWNRVVFGLSAFLPCLETGSLKEKMDPAVMRESYNLFEVDNHTYSRVNIMESNDSLNILKVSEADEEKTISDEFSLSFGQQLAILVSFWLLASLVSIFVGIVSARRFFSRSHAFSIALKSCDTFGYGSRSLSGVLLNECKARGHLRHDS